MVIRSARVAPFPAELCLVPVGRRPLRLPEATIQTMRNTVLPTLPAPASVPRASIVMVTYNRLAFSVGCLASLLANSATTPEYEIIVVDNASTDGTGEYLQTAAAHQPRIRVVRNSENRGFAPAVNQGLHLATGDVLVILNNDTLVPPGWLEGLSRHLADPNVGLVGPVTNSAPNEAQVETPYRTYGGFEDFAETCKRTFAGVRSVIPMLTMFCVAMRRSTLEALGPLDERYAVGTFEDDDYSQLAHQAGYAVVCAEDVFVHHFGQASFGELVPGGRYAALLSANRQRFEDKWQIGWQPHARRPDPTYQALVERIRTVVQTDIPPRATVLVVSRGDDALLDLGAARRGWHFPQMADGAYAGYYPADSAAAITHLEDLRDAGADHLLLPSTSLWWLDHYAGLHQHLEARYARLVHDHETCCIYDLRGRRPA